jgi:hypothetical protein
MVRLGSAEHKTATRLGVQDEKLLETTRAECEDELLCMCNQLGTVWHLQPILQKQIRHMWGKGAQTRPLQCSISRSWRTMAGIMAVVSDVGTATLLVFASLPASQPSFSQRLVRMHAATA